MWGEFFTLFQNERTLRRILNIAWFRLMHRAAWQPARAVLPEPHGE